LLVAMLGSTNGLAQEHKSDRLRARYGRRPVEALEPQAHPFPSADE
jgi:hypothetical protein